MQTQHDSIPRKEYPRPQFARDDSSWMNLNGAWAFAFDEGKSGLARGMEKPDAAYPLTITVPFCPESKLSGLAHTDFINAVWYKRKIELRKEQLAGSVLLHFGAADYETQLYVNGKPAGTHKGGYSSFAFDITPYVEAGENTLTVCCVDDVRSGKQPRGKQSTEYFSHGCDYTRTTGIWQTVWLEFLPKAYIDCVHVETDMSGFVTFRARVIGDLGKRMRVKAIVSFRGETIGERNVAAHVGENCFGIRIRDDKLYLWDVGKPNLYDVTYQLLDENTPIDSVNGYFGVRQITLNHGALCINNRPVFQRLVLDQGFYPEGIYTAPSDEALKGDIEISMGLGFNGARLHQKVFEERFLYWADRMGYIVWGEHANWGLDHTGAESIANFLPEWLEIVARDSNHPAIIGWCPFNETWDANGRQQYDELLRVTYLATKAADPTRPVIDTSGNFHVVTDIYDIHDYEQDVPLYTERYGSLQKGEIYENFPKRQKYEGQPYFISEFGGAWWAPERKDGWGYGTAPKTEEEFAARYEGLTSALLASKRVCGYCYTQLTNVEQEQNGLVRYDRTEKFSKAVYQRIYNANTAPAAIEGNP